MNEQQLKIFFAVGAREFLMLLLICGVKNILCSYEYPEPYNCKKLLKRHGIKLMIDSGAFSAWSKGRVINLDEYIEFIIKNKDIIDPKRIVNLDIILGGREGLVTKQLQEGTVTLKEVWNAKQKSGKEDFEEACRKGFENYYYMLEKLTPIFGEELEIIHTFHQGDDFKWLHKMLKECKSIGVSPNNDETDENKDRWLMECFRIIQEVNPSIKTHAFGVTSNRLLDKFPYTTADSSSWAMTSAFGSILTPSGRFVVSEQSKEKPGYIDKYPQQTKEALEKYLAEFGLTLEGVKKKYKYRNIINIFYFLNLEERINRDGRNFEEHAKQTSLFGSPSEVERLRQTTLKNNIL